MSRRGYLAGTAFVVLACGSPTTIPNGLVGDWGGVGARIEASPSRMQVTLRCLVAELAPLTRDDPSGAFESEGKVSLASWSGVVGWPARIEGEISGSRIQFRLQMQNSEGLWTTGDRVYEVHAGTPPDFISEGGSCIV